MGDPWMKSADENWKPGDILIANTSDFDLTEGKEYPVVNTNFSGMGLVGIMDDRGIIEDYTSEYFDRKTEAKGRIEMTDDELRIYDQNDQEIVIWTQDQWIDDPSLVLSMVNAVHILHTQGPEFLKTILNEV